MMKLTALLLLFASLNCWSYDSLVLSFQTRNGRTTLKLGSSENDQNLATILRTTQALTFIKSKGGHIGCGCMSPLDLLVVFDKTRTDTTQFFCSVILRRSGKARFELKADKLTTSRLNGRWQAVRAKYCNQPFGCEQGGPRWSLELIDHDSSRAFMNEMAWNKSHLLIRSFLDSLETNATELSFDLHMEIKNQKAVLCEISNESSAITKWGSHIAKLIESRIDPAMDNMSIRTKVVLFNYYNQQ